MNFRPRIYIGPMSKNIVDSVIEANGSGEANIALIPSRRQVEFSGGYVNGWTTKQFSEYVKESSNTFICRDHGGPNQGYESDDGLESFRADCVHFDMIHIDPWFKHKEIKAAADCTSSIMEYCFEINEDCEYEIGTEEAIRKYSPSELSEFLGIVKNRVSSEIWDKVVFAVIQSGTKLSMDSNIGEYDEERLLEMIEVCNEYDLLSKEHNGDYISEDLIAKKFSEGLYAINIAPEFGRIETQTVIDMIGTDSEDFNLFFRLCKESMKWVKWFPKGFDPDSNRLSIVLVSGHYVFSHKDFISMKERLDSSLLNNINENILKKIRSLENILERDE